ncbi:MAG: serpin family protein [Sulfurimonas sp.]|nr:serpin family protein [Sulfurimonas sp.]
MTSHKILFKVLISTVLLLLAGCNESTTIGDNQTSVETNVATLESGLARNLAPTSSSEDELLALADNNNNFAFKMFKKLYESDNSNIFFSPYSISEALAIAYAGANGTTKTEMSSVFNFDLANDSKLHNTFNALDLHLNYSDDYYNFEINNAFWVQKNYPILDSYLDTIKVNYGANIKILDFLNEIEASRVAINDWVKEKTHDRIQEIISKGNLDPFTVVAMTNAIYFKGKWLTEFQKSYTKENTFTAEDGSMKQITFMKQFGSNLKYMHANNYQAVELPYIGGRSSMLIILPDEGEFSNTLNSIETIYQSIGDMNYEYVNLTMPKFEFASPAYDIKEMLIKLGMATPFIKSADFSNMTTDNTVYINSIQHKAFLKVDENGTEATAVTVVTDSNGSSPSILANLDINRPFFIFIKDDTSKQILFLGVMKNF